MQSKMKKLLLTALLCFSINGFAFNWVKVSKNSMGNSYVDVDSIKKRDGLIYCQVLIDNLKSIAGASYSSIGKWKVDCSNEKVVWLSLSSYSKSMGEGKITSATYHSSNLVGLTPNKILYPTLNSPYYNLMKFACDNGK